MNQLHGCYHGVVRLRVAGREALFDQAIAPLVKELWRADIAIAMCCEQDEFHRVWLKFADCGAAQRFLNVVCAIGAGRWNSLPAD